MTKDELIKSLQEENTKLHGRILVASQKSVRERELEKQHAQLVQQVESAHKKLRAASNYCVQRDIGTWGESGVDALIRHYDALAARVEVLQKAYDEFCETNGDAQALHDAFKVTPAECLAQVKADAGRAGWDAAVQHYEPWIDCYYATSEETDKRLSDEYYQQVLKGDIK